MCVVLLVLMLFIFKSISAHSFRGARYVYVGKCMCACVSCMACVSCVRASMCRVCVRACVFVCGSSCGRSCYDFSRVFRRTHSEARNMYLGKVPVFDALVGAAKAYFIRSAHGVVSLP